MQTANAMLLNDMVFNGNLACQLQVPGCLIAWCLIATLLAS
jgi:hypothetical protein